MISYCGTCGFQLEEQALQAGRCGHCGAQVSAGFPNDALRGRDGAAAELRTQPSAAAGDDLSSPTRPQLDAFGAALANQNLMTGEAETRLLAAEQESRLHPNGTSGVRQRDKRPHRRRRNSRLGLIWAFALLSAVVLLLTGAAIATLAHRNPLSVVLAPFASANASTSSSASSSASSQSSGGPAATATAGGGGAPSSSPTSTPSGAPTPTPAASPSSTPVPPILSVTPTAINVVTCLPVLPAQTHFTVANTGGAPLSWSATNDSGYQFSPSGGTLDSGQQQTVKVSNITGSGTVTVTANAQNSPQQVTITCTA